MGCENATHGACHKTLSGLPEEFFPPVRLLPLAPWGRGGWGVRGFPAGRALPDPSIPRPLSPSRGERGEALRPTAQVEFFCVGCEHTAHEACHKTLSGLSLAPTAAAAYGVGAAERRGLGLQVSWDRHESHNGDRGGLAAHGLAADHAHADRERDAGRGRRAWASSGEREPHASPWAPGAREPCGRPSTSTVSVNHPASPRPPRRTRRPNS